jgi:hypothetical protein
MPHGFAPPLPVSTHLAARLHLLHLSNIAARPMTHDGHRIAISTVVPVTGDPCSRGLRCLVTICLN